MATLDEHKERLKSAHNEIFKVVNGTRSKLTDSEYDAQIDVWATNDKAQEDKDAIVNDGGTHSDYKAIRRDSYINLLGDVYDQLDYIYHNGLDAWKVQIKIVKDKYPKP